MLWPILESSLLPVQSTPTPSPLPVKVVEDSPTLLDDVNKIVDMFGTAVTALALIIGGVWAYFKFVKGRTYRPRLEVGLYGQWVTVDRKRLLHARLTVKNIGASVVNLLQEGTGLRISVPERDQPPTPVAQVWRVIRVFEVLGEHEWIEPQETVSDDLLLDLGVSAPALTLFEARLVWRWPRRQGNIVVFARQVVPVDSTIDASDTVNR
jgi:hypothetical protein